MVRPFFMFLSPLEQILQSVHIECEGETQGLVKRIALCRGNHITAIESEGTHAETGTHSEILSVSLILRLMMITGLQRELVVVYIFGTNTPVHLLKFLLKSTRCIAKALEDTGDAAGVVVFVFYALIVVLRALPFILLRV